MEKRKEVLQQYVSDMLAVEKHIHEAIRHQRDDRSVASYYEAHQLVDRLEATIDRHIEALEQHLASIGVDPATPVKDAVTSTLGALAGLYDKVRSSSVAKMLRDDYTALSLASISYTMLHTTGLALQAPSTADLALRHLKDVTPFITELSRIIPNVVARELAEEEDLEVDATAGAKSELATQQAWSPEHTGQRIYA